MTLTINRVVGAPYFAPVLVVALLATVSLQHTRTATAAAYGLTILVYAVIAMVCLTADVSIVAKRRYVILFLSLAMIITARTVLSPTLGASIRLAAFLLFTSANLFLIPQLVSFRDFLFASSWFSALTVLLGFAGYFSPSLLPFTDLSVWGGRLYIWPALAPITSIYWNPNALGFLALTGSLSALGLWRLSGSLPAGLLAVNGIGLAFTNYRTGILALAIALVLYSIFVLAGRELFSVATSMGVVGSVIGLLMLFGVLPAPQFLTEVSLNNRRLLWTAALHAFAEQPVWGYGFGSAKAAIQPFLAGTDQVGTGIHNSYLRMFVALGVSGGLAYLAFVISVVVGSARAAADSCTAGVSVLVVALALVQVFNGLTFTGISLHSTVISIAMGYHITGPAVVRRRSPRWQT